MRASAVILIAAYLLTFAASWHGCQTNRGRSCEALHTVTMGVME